MTLATRCPTCGTVFRVVQDQLRVSEGWVRCGRCTEVFNAVERLVDMDAEGAPLPGTAQSPRFDEPFDEPRRETRQDVLPPPAPEPPLRRERGPEPVAEQAQDAALLLRQESAHAADPAPADAGFEAPPAPRRSPAPSPAPAWLPSPEAADLQADAPDFVRQADRAERWRRSPKRAVLAGAGLVALLGLAAQVALEYRDAIAARWLAARPALEQACAWTGCRIEPPRMIEALVVESSGLLRVEATSFYRLTVVLRNRAPVALAAPSLDVALTDAQGRVISRRVLGLADLGLQQQSLAADSEQPMKAVIAVAEGPVTGYTIDIFYP